MSEYDFGSEFESEDSLRPLVKEVGRLFRMWKEGDLDSEEFFERVEIIVSRRYDCEWE